MDCDQCDLANITRPSQDSRGFPVNFVALVLPDCRHSLDSCWKIDQESMPPITLDQ